MRLFKDEKIIYKLPTYMIRKMGFEHDNQEKEIKKG